MISIRHVTKRFGGFTALDDCSMEVERGEVVVVCGPSGSGKSTLIKCVNALIPIDSGDIHVGGVHVNGRRTDRPKLRAKVGMVFQHFELFPHLSVLDNICLGQEKSLGRERKEAVAKADGLLQRVGLSDQRDKYPAQLSGGQQQRVAIARAVAQQPTLILADEPMASLDPKLSNVIMGILKEFNKDGISVLVNIHVLELAVQYADRILGFNKGRLVFDGPPSALTEAEIERIYSGSVADL